MKIFSSDGKYIYSISKKVIFYNSNLHFFLFFPDESKKRSKQLFIKVIGVVGKQGRGFFWQKKTQKKIQFLYFSNNLEI